jgi:hypothetical protein
MTSEVPIEILHLPAKLHELFDGRLLVAVAGTPEERERNFLSRAVGAYAIHKLAGPILDVAAACVVDGGGDGGIDAIHYSAGDQKLWIVQGKFT